MITNDLRTSVARCGTLGSLRHPLSITKGNAMQSVAIDTSTHVSSVAKKRSTPLDPQTADRLLDLLSTDDAFRRLFRRDARKALEQVGFVESPLMASPARCFIGISKLASKADISKARGDLTTMLTGGLAYITPHLDAAITAERRTRK